MAFILALLSLMVMAILGVLCVQISVNNLLTARRHRDQEKAMHLAEAAADMAEGYLQSLSTPPTSDINYPGTNQVVTLASGTCSAVIANAPGNAGAWLKSYIITATGTSRGGITSTIKVQLRQQSFGLYSYFSDQEVSSITGDTIWFFARDRLRGPVHTNDQFHISWDKTSADPIFYDTVSSADDSVDWNPSAGPQSTNDWRRVIDGGQAAFSLGVNRIELPDSTDRQKVAAWGADSNFPTSNGITLPASGSTLSAGIYIRGDCTMTFSVENSTGNQVIAITQGSTTKTINVDRAANVTRVTQGGTTTTYSGVPNGVIYSTGHVTSLKGTLADNYYSGTTINQRNSWTVATDVANGKDITVTDNLVYKTEPDETKPATHTSNVRAATLGLVAEDVVLGSSCPNEMSIDGVIMAGGRNTAHGSFYYSQWDSNKQNNLNIRGGIIQKQRGPVSTFNNSNNTLSTGYNKNYNYDPRMVDAPPPFFPTTGVYDRLSWRLR